MSIRKFYFFICLFCWSLGFAFGETRGLDQLTKEKQVQYRCPPCGCDSEYVLFAQPGICPSCGMQLVPINEGFAQSIDRLVAPLFYDQHLVQLYTKLLYPIFLAGIVFSLIWLFGVWRNPRLNVFLLGMVFILSLYGFKSQLYGPNYQMMNDVKGLFIPISFILALGPCLYFYVRNIIQANRSWSGRDFWHFVPTLLIVLVYASGFLLSKEHHLCLLASPFEFLLGHSEQGIAVLLGLIYLTFAYQSYQEWQKGVGAETVALNAWLQRLMLGMGIFFLAWACLLVLNYWLYAFGIATVINYPLWILYALGISWLGMEMMIRPQLTIWLPTLKKVPENLNFDEHTLAQKDQLVQLMEEQKIYRNQQLSLQLLSEQMEMNPRQLSEFLNKVVGKSFYELVNYYRVEEVKCLLLDPQYRHLTIEAMAQSAGFKSKSTFNAAFKKQSDMTPRQYLKAHSRKDQV